MQSTIRLPGLLLTGLLLAGPPSPAQAQTPPTAEAVQPSVQDATQAPGAPAPGPGSVTDSVPAPSLGATPHLPAQHDSATPRSGRIDSDGDGRISREEARQNAVLHQNFDAIDTDHDGQLTLEEIRNFKAPRSHSSGSKRKAKSSPQGGKARSKPSGGKSAKALKPRSPSGPTAPAAGTARPAPGAKP